jgi:uncharacterized membrane protein
MVSSLLFIYLLMVAGGVVLELSISRLYFSLTKEHLNKHHFPFGRYIYLLLFPALGTFSIYLLRGEQILRIFIIFAILGPILEWLTGYAYYRIVGTRLWLYRRFAYQGHTSLLTIPLWGMTGVLFWLISRSAI